MKLKIFLILTFLLFGTGLFAQLFPIESSIPPGIEWQQINTDTVRLVFPRGLERQANRLTNMVHYMVDQNQQSLGNGFKKIDIFLLNKTVESNGYVTVAPFHSKFYTQAPQLAFAGSTDWLDLLAIHEYRHVMQYNNAKNGLTKWLYYIFGESLLAGASHLAVPPWFWEGDAVVQETALSYSGRGRIPAFTASLNAIADQNTPFSYEKMVCGSYKDNIPDHYTLGYALNLYGRQNFGNDFWVDVFKDATAFKGILWPFSEAIKYKTGKRTRDLYKSMMNERVSGPQIPDNHRILSTSYDPSNPSEYSFPRFRNNDQIIAIKESFNREAYFVTIDEQGIEKDLFPIGFGMGSFDVNEKGMVWNEIVTHPRWSNVSFSNLFQYNFDSDKIQRLTKNTRLFEPKFNADTKRIAAIQTYESESDQLVLLESSSGEVVDILPNPEHYVFKNLCWIDGARVAMIAQKNNRNSIVEINLESRKYRTILAMQTQLIESLTYYKDRIYFLSNNGNPFNQVFAVDLNTGKVSEGKLKGKYLVEMPHLSDKGKMVFVETVFNQKKLEVVYESVVFDHATSERSKPFRQPFNSNTEVEVINRISEEEGGAIVFKIPPTAFDVKAYRPGIGKLKLHSWIPSPIHPNYGIQFQANDALSTIGIFVEPGFNSNEKVFYTKMNIEYGAWLPKFDLGLNTYQNRSAKFRVNEDQELNLKWDERTVQGSIHLPLQFSKRNYYYSFRPAIGYEFIRTTGLNILGKENFQSLFFEFSAGALRRRAYRSIRSKNSANISFAAQKIINNDDQVNLSGDLNVYLPGIKNTHSTYLELDYRYQHKGNEYLFLDTYYYAGAYNAGINSDWVTGLKLHYAFPVWYPDIAIGPFAFFKRLRMDLHYDWDWYGNKGIGLTERRSAFGFFLLTDAKYFRLVDLPIGLGVDFEVDDGDVKFGGIRIVADIL